MLVIEVGEIRRDRNILKKHLKREQLTEGRKNIVKVDEDGRIQSYSIIDNNPATPVQKSLLKVLLCTEIHFFNQTTSHVVRTSKQ